MPQRRVTRSKTTMYTPGKPSSPGGTAAMNLIRQRASCPFMVRDAPVGGVERQRMMSVSPSSLGDVLGSGTAVI